MQQLCLCTTRHACKAMVLPYPDAGWHLGFQACTHLALPEPPLALQAGPGPGSAIQQGLHLLPSLRAEGCLWLLAL